MQTHLFYRSVSEDASVPVIEIAKTHVKGRSCPVYLVYGQTAAVLSPINLDLEPLDHRTIV